MPRVSALVVVGCLIGDPRRVPTLPRRGSGGVAASTSTRLAGLVAPAQAGSKDKGLDIYNPVLVQLLHPRVAVVNNGSRTGCQPGSFATIKGSKGLEAVYQLHRNLVAPDSNTTPDKIANADETCAANFIKLPVDLSGKTYKVSIPATGHEKTYETKRS